MTRPWHTLTFYLLSLGKFQMKTLNQTLFFTRFKNPAIKLCCLLVRFFSNGLNYVFLFLIRGYQLLLSPYLGGNCRYEPSCSCYALTAFHRLPFWKALFLSTKRVLSCHPFGGQGYDPVPEYPNKYSQVQSCSHHFGLNQKHSGEI